jgi:hypothetical protein
MEPKCSLPCSQKPATCPYHQPDECIQHPHTFFHMIHFNIILASTPSLPSGLVPSGFQIKIWYAFIISPMRATCLSPLVLRDWIILLANIWWVQLWSCSWCFLQPPVTVFLDSDILLSTLFSNTLNLCSYLNVWDKKIKKEFQIHSLQFCILYWPWYSFTGDMISQLQS